MVRGLNLLLKQEAEIDLEAGKLLGLPEDAGNALNIEVTINRGSAKQSGILIGSDASQQEFLEIQ